MPYNTNNNTFDIHKKRTMLERYSYCIRGISLLLKDNTIYILFILGLLECIVIFILILSEYLPKTTPFTIFLVPISIEILNTSIETAVDHTSIKKSFLAAKAKDTAAAASMIISVATNVYWFELLRVVIYNQTKSLLFSIECIAFIFTICYSTVHFLL